MTPDQQLSTALSSPAALLAWCASRGYSPVDDTQPVGRPPVGARHLVATNQPDAPRILLVARPEIHERAIHGNALRKDQIEANSYRTELRATGMGSVAPALCLVAGADFLVAFPLDGNAYSRRMRFTPARLRGDDASTLIGHFNRFNAVEFARIAIRPPEAAGDDDVVAALLSLANRAVADITWPWDKVFVGAKLDDRFVAFMRSQRYSITKIALDEVNRDALLTPIHRLLSERGSNAERLPLASLVKDRAFRSGLIATVDTVLLRLVLYRYLEAQFGYTAPAEEEKRVALGSYDELLARTTEVSREELTKLIQKMHKAYEPARVQVGLFGAPIPTGKSLKLTRSDDFAAGVSGNAERYQSIAGGDLHQGRIAEAADVLQAWLLQHHREEFALLLAGTSTDDYSFHYADLEAQALQSFYQDTIGTDIRISYDLKTHAVTVGVADHQKNRKEQGAYYTGERMCAWLVERTIGYRFEEWIGGLNTAVRLPAGERRKPVADALTALLNWRILDPTCGGGMFLRAAFEYLSAQHRRIREVLKNLTDGALAEVTGVGAAHVFSADAKDGEWQWHILLHMLHGIDVDVKAVNVASNLLTLSALTYKPNGICFPSFVNVSLKQGNALIVPLKPAERAEFARAYGAELVELLDLRKQLRDPGLERKVWKAAHATAAGIARRLVDARIVIAYAGLFPGLGNNALIERVRRVGLFLYEVEFPEAYFEVKLSGKTRRVVVRENPGFDFVLGNPPWEEPAAEFKQFLPDFDPGYLELSGAASEAREKELLADPEIAARWAAFELSIQDYKALLTSGWYEHQRRAVNGRIPGAHTNLYKYATEMAWQLLRTTGMAGIVTDAGLWQDLASSGLRALLLDRAQVHALCGFVNTEGVFPDVEPRQRFCLNVFAAQGRTETLRMLFMQTSLSILDTFHERSVELSVNSVRSDRRGSYPVPELRAGEQLGFEQALARQPSLGEAPWNVDTYSRELNSGEQRGYFHTEFQPGFRPLVQGTQFNIFGVQFGEPPSAWLDPGLLGVGGFLRAKQEGRVLDAIATHVEDTGGAILGTREDTARAWVEERTGGKALPDAWVRLDWEGHRMAWRDVARSDDQRSLIVGILPIGIGVAHTAPYVRPFRLRVEAEGVQYHLQYELPHLLFLAGVLSTFVVDGAARTRIGKNHLSTAIFHGLPVPKYTASAGQERIASLTARLTCLPPGDRPWADYTELAAAVGLTPERDGLLDPADRDEAEVELNALAAGEYGLGRGEFTYLMDTLFMTPKHRERHALMKQRILGRLGAERA